MKLPTLALLLASSPAFAAGINVSGNIVSNYGWPSDSDCHMGLSGVGVSITYQTGLTTGCSGGTTVMKPFPGEYGYASIGDLGSRWFTFGVGNGSGHLTLFSDVNGTTEIATTNLIGWLVQTSRTDQGRDFTESFAIVPNPEPAYSWLVLVLGAGIFALRHRQRADSVAGNHTDGVGV